MKSKLLTVASLFLSAVTLAGCAGKNPHQFDSQAQKNNDDQRINSISIKDVSFVSPKVWNDHDIDKFIRDMHEKGTNSIIPEFTNEFEETVSIFENVQPHTPILFGMGERGIKYIKNVTHGNSKEAKVTDEIVDSQVVGVIASAVTEFNPDGSIKLGLEYSSRESLGVQKLSNGQEFPILSERSHYNTVSFEDKRGKVINLWTKPINIDGKVYSKVEFIYVQINN